MSSRPPGQDRFSQMSEQAAIIARKKAEIEAKLKAAADGKNEAKTVKDSSLLSSKSTPPGKLSKNRWGFKGKRPNTQDVSKAQEESEDPSRSSPHTSQFSNDGSSFSHQFQRQNQFSNDGSFLEQFKKLKEQPKNENEQVAPVQQEAQPAMPSPSQQNDWYKAALARAKQIAHTMTAPMEPKKDPDAKIKDEPKPEPKDSEYGSPVKSEYSPTKPTPPTPNKSGPPSGIEQSEVKQEDDDQDAKQYQSAAAADEPSLPTHVDELASMVAVSGDHVEEIARARNVGEEALAFLFDAESDLYQRYRRKVETFRKGVIAESSSRKEEQKKKKKSRWGDESDKVVLAQPGSVLPQMMMAGSNAPPGTHPQLIQYAIKVFGTTDLDASQWKQCEDQLKMNCVYNALLTKQKQAEIMAQQGKRQYEYDSDEDIEGGTWEHKARKLEMEKTLEKSSQLTESAQGKHHIGDFLPPEELTKFMSKFQSIKSGATFVDESDYAEQKLTQNNLGFKMLQRMGWNEGKGLGSDGQGITAPINQGQKSGDKKGLGTATPHDLQSGDDEFDAYRKRMMMAYRFRPNPLNNPRRAYY